MGLSLAAVVVTFRSGGGLDSVAAVGMAVGATGGLSVTVVGVGPGEVLDAVTVGGLSGLAVGSTEFQILRELPLYFEGDCRLLGLSWQSLVTLMWDLS